MDSQGVWKLKKKGFEMKKIILKTFEKRLVMKKRIFCLDGWNEKKDKMQE